MKREYILEAGRRIKFLKQELDDEDELGNVNIQVLLSEDLGIKKGEKVKITLEVSED